MLDLAPLVFDAAGEVRRRWPAAARHPPRMAIILGTGLGSLADDIEADVRIDYGDIPHFPPATVASHAGQLVCGRLEGVPVVAMSGRLHYYEGDRLWQATLPVRVMRALGATTLLVSSAAGGMNPYHSGGDVVVLDDHINLLPDNPFVGVRCDARSMRSARFARPYDEGLIERAMAVARRLDISLHRGVYVAMPGPNLETRAEYRLLRRIGGDVVGMSTVHEVLVGIDEGMRVAAFSVVSNVCLPDALPIMSLDEIVAIAARGEHNLRRIVRELVREIPAMNDER